MKKYMHSSNEINSVIRSNIYKHTDGDINGDIYKHADGDINRCHKNIFSNIFI